MCKIRSVRLRTRNSDSQLGSVGHKSRYFSFKFVRELGYRILSKFSNYFQKLLKFFNIFNYFFTLYGFQLRLEWNPKYYSDFAIGFRLSYFNFL
ncbi:hypothetical protein RCL_jg13081.t1 [Rhizophagus clarus]|uniref:Uncharacterized protein n=1 Tax=Rhizophagus clarus TaxID=94130 RepID=A0A8H3KXU1_9GLOM|nr:hypothetical protein RCL_jg13081.t1 [Rhizophagus clarus]